MYDLIIGRGKGVKPLSPRIIEREGRKRELPERDMKEFYSRNGTIQNAGDKKSGGLTLEDGTNFLHPFWTVELTHCLCQASHFLI